MDVSRDEYLKVGELSRRTGVSVRALHHYDEIGLLPPAIGGKGEQRLYGRTQIARLQRIRSLQALGFSLEEIGSCLDEPGFEPLGVVERHLGRVKESLALASSLRARLEAIASSLRAATEPSTEDLVRAIETMSQMEHFEKYYTPEQKEQLARRARTVGQERIEQVQREWQELFAEYRAAMQRGEEPASEPVQALARRAQALVAEFTGGDAGLHASLTRAYAEHPAPQQAWGVEAELAAYMTRASEALGG